MISLSLSCLNLNCCVLILHSCQHYPCGCRGSRCYCSNVLISVLLLKMSLLYLLWCVVKDAVAVVIAVTVVVALVVVVVGVIVVVVAVAVLVAVTFVVVDARCCDSVVFWSCRCCPVAPYPSSCSRKGPIIPSLLSSQTCFETFFCLNCVALCCGFKKPFPQISKAN